MNVKRSLTRINTEITETCALSPTEKATETKSSTTDKVKLNILFFAHDNGLNLFHDKLRIPRTLKVTLDTSVDCEPLIFLVQRAVDDVEDFCLEAIESCLVQVESRVDFGALLEEASAVSASRTDFLFEFFTKGSFGIALNLCVFCEPLIKGRRCGRERPFGCEAT